MRQVRIERLGHLGDGLGEGVIVPRALPGELVEGEARDGRLEGVRILDPAPERVAPPCPHFRRCGGCAVQHLRDDAVAEWKTGIVRHALAAQGIQAEIEIVSTSPPLSRRRAVLAARRTKKGALAGYHMRGSDEIVAVPECRVLHPSLLDALPVAEALAEAGASRKDSLDVAVTLTEAGLDVSVSGGKRLDERLRTRLAQLAARHDLARLTWNGEPVAQARPPVLHFGRAVVSPPPGAFLQPTAEGEAALVARVRALLAGAGRVADLFAGCGTFALPLAETAEVHAVEGEAAMLAALDAGWRRARGLKRVTTETRDLFRRPLDPAELARFDAAVIDPPRQGAAAQVAALAQARVPRIAHVSCNPATFARDTAALVAAGYRMGPITVVDQFRWSPHVELVAGLALTHMPGGDRE
ncbi:class I SAM-dependent RNA methyltransferase [Rhodosalinus halophilus]|uniref:Class I SAM-dependent RNA methyltransferase n=1 Tax=Rhodosalinus halophilus TaxID=2259333 RepID=A0A365U7T6_9RHOB|nr:class I SAM-dependent RNA methyltransferase [Rhodosalinus halophilus]RBI84687.1 class I SAM-dependent RNA methyltransferase [Rhodosalinus halophilus]